MPITVSSIPLFKGVSAEDLAQVSECLQEKVFSKGDNIFLSGSSCEKIFFVKSGQVKIYRLSADGKEQILEMLGAGDTCGCNPGTETWSCSSSAKAQTAATLWFISRANYARLISSHPILAKNLNSIFANRLQCMMSLAGDLSLKDSRKRLADFLLSQAVDRPISMTREEMAQRIGVTRETVTRHLYELKRKKIIDIRSRCIFIQNVQELQRQLN